MDLITKVSSLVASIIEPNDLHTWWATQQNTPSIPSYWKKKGAVAVLKSFGSNGSVIDLKAYTSLLGSKVKVHIKGWVSTPTSMVLVVDPKDLPSDIINPYIILAMPSDVMDYELVINQIKRSQVNPCSINVEAKIGYCDKYRKLIRFDIPEELE